MRDFDFYEFAGVIAPGMLVAVGGSIIMVPDYEQLSKLANLSVGGLGVGLVVAYVAGQLIQALGNGLEKIWWWIRGGMPTDWVRSGKHKLIADSQLNLLRDQIRLMLKKPDFELNSSLNAKQWYSITRQLYAAIESAKRTTRVDVFNGNYGLHRGIASGLIVLLIMIAIVDWHLFKYELILAVLFSMAVYRMNRFGVHYGRELFVQFICLDEANGK